MSVVVIFTSTRTVDDDAGYDVAAARMVELAGQQPGFLGIESVRDPVTCRGITVSYWTDEASARAWKAVTEHRTAQESGRDRWYSEYEVVVAEVSRSYRHPA